MELADFFAIDRLSQHDEELLIESAMQMQQMMQLAQCSKLSRQLQKRPVVHPVSLMMLLLRLRKLLR